MGVGFEAEKHQKWSETMPESCFSLFFADFVSFLLPIWASLSLLSTPYCVFLTGLNRTDIKTIRCFFLFLLFIVNELSGPAHQWSLISVSQHSRQLCFSLITSPVRRWAWPPVAMLPAAPPPTFALLNPAQRWHGMRSDLVISPSVMLCVELRLKMADNLQKVRSMP